ncbi:MAG: hypothetical protein ACYC4U_10645, partial [Pirellulaceae bacterium]
PRLRRPRGGNRQTFSASARGLRDRGYGARVGESQAGGPQCLECKQVYPAIGCACSLRLAAERSALE